MRPGKNLTNLIYYRVYFINPVNSKATEQLYDFV